MAELFNHSLLSMAGDHAIADFEMTCNTDLSGEDHVAADFGAAAESDLSAEKRVFADLGGVTYLYEVVDLGAAANACLADGCAIDGRVGADFDVVFEDDNTGLHDLVVAAVVFFRISVAIGADLGSVLEDHVVADAAELADGHVSVGLEVIADARATVDMDEGINRAVLSDLHVVFDDDERADRCALAYLCRRCDPCRWIYSMCLPRCFVEDLDSAREREVGICVS